MLSGPVKDGVVDILSLMSGPDVISLAQTITNRFIKVESVDEAVKAIWMYGADGIDVLRRKKVKKDTLIKYLHNNQIPVNVHTEKKDIVNVVLKHWNSPICEEEMESLESLEEETTSQPSLLFDQKLQNMGETFATWFYQLLNSVSPCFSNTTVLEKDHNKFGPHHFWSDCKFRVDVRSSGNRLVYSGNSGVEASSIFTNLVLNIGLLFNPNATSEGIHVKSDSFGLVQISVSGFIYSTNTCSGMFRQLFGLVQDVHVENNWKIKFTELNGMINTNASLN